MSAITFAYCAGHFRFHIRRRKVTPPITDRDKVKERKKLIRGTCVWPVAVCFHLSEELNVPRVGPRSERESGINLMSVKPQPVRESKSV